MDKEKAIITDGLSSFAPPIGESYNFDAMAIYLTIRKTMF
jgi:Na+/H+-dicarboxylate symporter